MAGIYIHIPFCASKCAYCNFYSVASQSQQQAYIQALLQEVFLRKNELSEAVETIYIGGGTPSLLAVADLVAIFEQLSMHYKIAADPEITMEANPESLDFTYLQDLRKYTPINRLSIGTQSFFDADLKELGRRHSGEQAIRSVRNAQELGYENISIDLIYGIPGLTDRHWVQNLEQAFQLEVPHLSCYALTVEPKTLLDIAIRKNEKQAPDEEQQLRQFEILLEMIDQNQYEQYEISNFSKSGRYSKHNTNYWKQKEYLGFGAAAHSYNGKSRRWNVDRLNSYIAGVEQQENYFEQEILTVDDCYNEFVMLALRTKWGVAESALRKSFDEQYVSHFLKLIQPWISQAYVEKTNENSYLLTKSGKLIADRIAADLFY